MIALKQFLLDNNALTLNHAELQDLMAEKKIRVSFNNGLVLFKYEVDADFSDPVVQNSRGIILYYNNFQIACYPFDKFNNFDDVNAAEIDWGSARCFEKLDGSLIKVWFNHKDNEWTVSTNGCIYASSAMRPDGVSFQHMYETAPNKPDLETLNKNYTYMFELVSPDNQIVVKYPETELWHIGTRDNISGQELEVDCGVQKPKVYKLHSLEECLDIVTNFDLSHEGLVVCDANYNRIKVKNPLYFYAHKLISTLNSSKPTEVLKLLAYYEKGELTSELPDVVTKTMIVLRDRIHLSKLSLLSILQHLQAKFPQDTPRVEVYNYVQQSVVTKSYTCFIMRGYNKDPETYVASLTDEQILKMDPDICKGLL